MSVSPIVIEQFMSHSRASGSPPPPEAGNTDRTRTRSQENLESDRLKYDVNSLWRDATLRTGRSKDIGGRTNPVAEVNRAAIADSGVHPPLGMPNNPAKK